MTDRALPLPPSQLSGPDVRKISRIDIGLKRRYAAERQPGEHFGDFTIRAGIVREVTEGRFSND